jgi:mannan endo-1,4-beta-mannosidase
MAKILTMILLVAGSAVRAQEPVILEAEDAELTGVSVSTDVKGFSGSGYVDGFDSGGDQVKFTFTGQTGMYEVLIGFNTPFGEKGFGLTINGADMGSMFPFSGGEFKEYEAGKIRLIEGENVAVITSGWGWYYLDYLKFVPATVVPPLIPPVTLADGEAIGSAQEVFEYLVGNYGTRVLSGQQSLGDIAFIRDVTGKTPAVGVFDFMDYSVSRQEHGAFPQETTEKMIAWQKSSGGLVSISWHWNAPTDLIDEPGSEWWRGFYTSATTFDLQAALSDTTSWRYRALLRDMDVIANELRKFYNEGIPVLWRPLHEASGGWFWWGAKGSEAYRQLWRIMYDRFTHHFGLHNLIWVSTHMANDWYAGDGYVDVVGLDIYESRESTMTGQWEGDQAHFNGRKLLALSESGTIPIPRNIIEYGTWWSWFSMWSGDYPRQVGDAILQEIYGDTLIITADELPAWDWEVPESLEEFEVTDPDAILEVPPVARDVTFTGDLLVGSTLTGSYQFSDTNGDSEGESSYQWYWATDAGGNDRKEIEGETGLTCVVGDAMRGCYMAFGITPVAATGSPETRVGKPVISAFGQVLTVVTDPAQVNKIRVYPNPVMDFLTIGPLNAGSAVTLTDLAGWIQQRLEVRDAGRVELDLSDLGEGPYVLKISLDQGNTRVFRIVKLK